MRTDPIETAFHHLRVTVNGRAVHVVTAGSPANPVILFLHGFPEDWSAFRKVMRNQQHDFYVISIDLPGIGSSDPIFSTFTTDYDSKFRISGLVNLGFCTPVFWTGEPFHASMISERTLAACYRTLYWVRHPKPRNLAGHIEQERFVAGKSARQTSSTGIGLPALEQFHSEHQLSSEYPVIFNFLYGDAASASLGLPGYGITRPYAGFSFAAMTSVSNGHK